MLRAGPPGVPHPTGARHHFCRTSVWQWVPGAPSVRKRASGYEGTDRPFNKTQLNSNGPEARGPTACLLVLLYAAALRTDGYGPSTTGGLYMQLQQNPAVRGPLFLTVTRSDCEGSHLCKCAYPTRIPSTPV